MKKKSILLLLICLYAAWRPAGAVEPNYVETTVYSELHPTEPVLTRFYNDSIQQLREIDRLKEKIKNPNTTRSMV